MPRTVKLREITVADREGDERMLLVVADSRKEARALARPRGRVTGISVHQGLLAVRGNSRVIGAVAQGRADLGRTDSA